MQQRIAASSADMLESSFREVLENSSGFADRFYERLFRLHPELRPLFRSPLAEQKRLLIGSLAVIVKGIRYPHEIGVMLGSLASVHVGYGVQPKHYPLIGANLIATLRGFMGPRWSKELELAWSETYEWIQERMLQSIGWPCSAHVQGSRGGTPEDAPAVRFGQDPLATAQEYIDLNRRWRQGGRLSAEQMEHWRCLRRMLEWMLHTTPPAVGTRRRSLRVPTRMSVCVEGEGSRASGMMTEIAEQGLFVVTDRPLEPGAKLQLEIVRGAGAPPLKLRGTVVWSRGPNQPDSPSGMGIQLEHLDESQRLEISNLVEGALLLNLSRGESAA